MLSLVLSVQKDRAFVVQSRCCCSWPWSKVLETHGGFLEARGCCWPSSHGLPLHYSCNNTWSLLPPTLLSLQWSFGEDGGVLAVLLPSPWQQGSPLCVCGGGTGLGEEQGGGDGNGGQLLGQRNVRAATASACGADLLPANGAEEACLQAWLDWKEFIEEHCSSPALCSR